MTVSPAIQEMLGVRRVIAHHRIKCFGVGESDLEAMLPDLPRDQGSSENRATSVTRQVTRGPGDAVRVWTSTTVDWPGSRADTKANAVSTWSP